MFFINLELESSIRYDLAKFLEFVPAGETFDASSSYFLNHLKDLTSSGSYVVSGKSGRPDLISFEIYGHTQYWWILMAYNEFIHPDDIEEGALMSYPSVESLEALYFRLNSLRSST